jgi:3-isopropylmalate/(R)-2-methylmalate dehydratase small subunit
MKPFTKLISRAAPLLRNNVDTDTIIPSREMRSTGKKGLADGLFAQWRYLDPDARTPNPDFVLNNPKFSEAEIILGGQNFGCGSSREHAVWALSEYGIRCIIAQSFAPIFVQNCILNGILPVVLPSQTIARLVDCEITVNLFSQQIQVNEDRWTFDIGEEPKTMLLEGLDAVALTMKHSAAIAAWQTADQLQRPYIYLGASG